MPPGHRTDSQPDIGDPGIPRVPGTECASQSGETESSRNCRNARLSRTDDELRRPPIRNRKKKGHLFMCRNKERSLAENEPQLPLDLGGSVR